MAKTADDVAKVLAFGRARGIPVTFRAGGTSLNGQGQTDGILVDVRRHFGGLTVLEDGAAVRVGTGTILGHVNRVLAPHGRRLGPDPASTDVATVGGVVANNSGGMRCGVTRDTYSTLRSMTFVLPPGRGSTPPRPAPPGRSRRPSRSLHAGLAAIRDEIRADADLAARIRRKFEIKNTTGYRLCAFLDADEPLEIFRRLLVGSEGTLAYIPEASSRPSRSRPSPPPPGSTSPTSTRHRPGQRPRRRRRHGGRADGRARADHRRLEHGRRAAGVEGARPDLGGAAGRVRRRDEEELDAQVAQGTELLGAHETIRPLDFTRDPAEIETAWRVREGLQGLVGRLRLPGTALILEDVCVPPARIAECAHDLQPLLTRHGFLPGVAGHASAGNLHFMLTPDFSKPEDTRALRGVHGGPGRADRRQVRRLAEGRARDRGEHGAVCGARVGDKGDRADVAGEAAGRSRRGALARRRPQPRPDRAPARPEDDAADRGVGDDLRRVRLLRAGLPEPRPDDDAAPADRPAAGDRATAERLGAAGGAARGARLRGARHLRGRRQLPARLSGRDRHRRRS